MLGHSNESYQGAQGSFSGSDCGGASESLKLLKRRGGGLAGAAAREESVVNFCVLG